MGGSRWLGGAPATVAASLVGALVGLGAFTFVYGEGVSYLSTDPAACANCHVMQEQYDSWTGSSHRSVAGCIDCHLPHDLVGKYVAKADNGLFHSWAFTFDAFPEPIRIKPRNHRILESNCVACHEELVHELLPASPSGEAIACIRCHADVGHAGARSTTGAALPRGRAARDRRSR